MGLVPGLGRAPGRGNGNSLQYSYLRNPMERGTWWATVQGVRKQVDTTEWLNDNDKLLSTLRMDQSAVRTEAGKSAGDDCRNPRERSESSNWGGGRELGDDEPGSGLIFKVYSIEVRDGWYSAKRSHRVNIIFYIWISPRGSISIILWLFLALILWVAGTWLPSSWKLQELVTLLHVLFLPLWQPAAF